MAIFISHFSITLMLTGIIWFIQLVHYPLFAHVGRSTFQSYTEYYRHRIFFFLLPFMFLEIITALLILIFPPFEINGFITLISWGLLLIIWVSSFLIQAPFHLTLSKKMQPRIIRMLVMTNWIRTLSWSLRALLVILMLFLGKNLFLSP